MTQDDPTRPVSGSVSMDVLYDATVRCWWARRWFILGAMLMAGVLLAAVVLLIPKSFRAQASVIVMPPRFVPEVRTQPLTVNTAQGLLNTPELHHQVIVTLRRQHDLVMRLNNGSRKYDVAGLDAIAAMPVAEIVSRTGMTEDEAVAIGELERTEIQALLDFTTEELAELNVDAVGEMLRSEETVEKKTAADLVFSPMLKLFAVAETGGKAQLLANSWARLFEKKYDMVARRQTQKLSASLEFLQREGQTELEMIQQELVEFRLLHNQDLIERQIQDYSDAFSSATVLLVKKQDQLASYETRARVYAELLGSLEGEGGEWMGNPALVLQAPSDGTSTVFEFAEIPDEWNDRVTSASVLTRETLRNRVDLQNALKLIADFQAENPVELLKSDAERYREDYLEQKSKYYASGVETSVLTESLGELDRELSMTSQVLELVGSLPDEAVGAALISGEDRAIARAGAFRLQRETVNPMWEKLGENRAEVNRELLLAQAQIAELEHWLPKEEREVAQFSQRVFRVEQAEKLANEQVNRFEQLNQLLYGHYVESKKEYLDCVLQMTILREEIGSLELVLERLRGEIEVFRERFENAESKIEVMELRKKAIEEQAELLTQKLQASLVAVGEDVTDVTIAARAVAPARHFFPPRTFLVLAGVLLTAGVIMAGMSWRRYSQLLDQR